MTEVEHFFPGVVDCGEGVVSGFNGIECGKGFGRVKLLLAVGVESAEFRVMEEAEGIVVRGAH